MAKRSSTVYLEEVFWEMITQYQEKNNLSSRNDALAFMLKEWEMLKQTNGINLGKSSNLNKMIEPINQTLIVAETIGEDEKLIKNEEENIKINPLIKNGLAQLYDNMK